jgi:hypothetical protein
MYKCPYYTNIKAIKKSKEVLELKELKLLENNNPNTTPTSIRDHWY